MSERMDVAACEASEEGEAWSAPWRPVFAALALSLAGTMILGSLAFILDKNVWWVGLAGGLSLFGGGTLLGWARGIPEPLDGTLLAILYFGVVVGVLFGGTLADLLPDPLPGLGVGDSTFFFVWPLLQLASAVAGSVVGGSTRPARGQP